MIVEKFLLKEDNFSIENKHEKYTKLHGSIS